MSKKPTEANLEFMAQRLWQARSKTHPGKNSSTYINNLPAILQQQLRNEAIAAFKVCEELKMWP